MRFGYEQPESIERGRKREREREKNKKHSVGDRDGRLTLVQDKNLENTEKGKKKNILTETTEET